MPKFDLTLSHPLMNAAGSLGFAPDPHGPVDLSRLGAFITNPISLGERTPAHGPRCLRFPGGFLLHTGYPNPGLKAAIRRFAARWMRSPLPVIVHLLAQSPSEAATMASMLEAVEGVAGLEIGLPPGSDAATALAFARAASGELPLILRLPLEEAARLVPSIPQGLVAAVSLAPPRGTLPTPLGGLVQGRLYGPAVYPLALSAVQALKRSGVPLIGAGGIYRQQDAESMLKAGAVAVQLDAVLWRGGV
jgi:dihydroorotate dehydrogenase (NAD+) catalytic subunit